MIDLNKYVNKLVFVLLVVLTFPIWGHAAQMDDEKIIVLTFDDAVKSHRTFVGPLLKELGFGATFFITHCWMSDTTNFMNWQDVADLYKMGFEIGNHTWSHNPVHDPQGAAHLQDELEKIEQQLQKRGIPRPVSFAYPGNGFGPEAVDVLRKKGYKFARRGMQPEIPYGKMKLGPLFDPTKHNPLLIPTSADAYPEWTLDYFKTVVNRAQKGKAVILQFHGVPDVAHPWVHTDPEKFVSFMRYLKDNDFTVIALKDLALYFPMDDIDDPMLKRRYPLPEAEKTGKAPSNDLQFERIAGLRTEILRIESYPPAEITLFNVRKAGGLISRLLDRAEQTITGKLPPPRFTWVRDGFEPPTKMIDRAEKYLRTLREGTDPFAGKFAEPGGTVIDHALIEKEGVHHLFYIRGKAATHWPEWPTRNFGHATSRDLINWEVHKPVLQSPDSGWDDYQVWAPYIIEHDGQYWMFYTGVNDSVCQAIGLARSKDLYYWERYAANPVIKPGPWGKWRKDAWSDCRDPMVLKDGDTFYCYYTAARTIDQQPGYESCVGIASSTDLLNWRDEGFIRLAESVRTPPESPFVVKRHGKYYLFYTNYKLGTAYAVSDNPIHGWRELAAAEATVISGVSASEVYRTGGSWYISMISHAPNALHFFEIRQLRWQGGRPYVVQ